MRLWLTVQPAFFASTADRPPLAEELLALGQLPDDLLRRVLALLHVVLSSFPMMGLGLAQRMDQLTGPLSVTPAASLAPPDP